MYTDNKILFLKMNDLSVKASHVHELEDLILLT